MIGSTKWLRTNGYKLRRLILLGQNLIKENFKNLKENINCSSSCCNDEDIREEIYVKYPTQSSEQQSNTESNSTIQEVNVHFNDEVPGEVLDVPSDIKAENVYTPEIASINKFLNRPVRIHNYNWVIGSQTNSEFDPWNLFFNHASIKRKLDNYYLIRCRLHLKFVINASPFHYGTMLACYKPLSKWLTPAFIDSTPSNDAQNIAYSQLPRVYIYPQTSQGGEMTLPFLWAKEWLDITTASETSSLGTVYMRPLTSLRFASAGTGNNCNIQVFAWAEDVQLSGPTVKLAMQAGEDEYGAISGPASAIANVAGMLEKAPVIGPFATATNMIASTVSGVAKLFGFTNVPVISDVKSFTPHPFPQFASPEIGTAIEKLTLDPKNELTIDPKSIGVDLGDELLIKNFTARESYLTQFTWTSAGAPGDILYSMQVTPYLERIEATTGQNVIQMTPMSLVGRMFAYWKGDIKVRLKFNCSQFHKGRLRISWDPVGAIGATADSTTEVFTHIVDLAECTDITMNIPYMQDLAFLHRETAFNNKYSNDGAQVHVPTFTNGVLTARILNELCSPEATADIQVLVFVSGGDNLEFASPAEIDPNVTFAPLCAFPVQSMIEHYDTSKTDVMIGDAPSVTPSTTYLTYHGEVVKSLRTLFRRTTLHTSIFLGDGVLTSTADGALLRNRLSRYPYYPGYNANGLSSAVSLIGGANSRYNYVKWHPLTWISQCFLGCRGAINYRFNANIGQLNIAHQSVVRSNLINNATLGTGTYVNNEGTSGTNTLSRLLVRYPDHAGMSITNTRTNTGLNASMPYYSSYKFRTTSRIFTTVGSSTDDSDKDWYQLQTLLNPGADSDATSTYKNAATLIYMGAGTDYSPIFFVNVPTLYLYNALPNSA